MTTFSKVVAYGCGVLMIVVAFVVFGIPATTCESTAHWICRYADTAFWTLFFGGAGLIAATRAFVVIDRGRTERSDIQPGDPRNPDPRQGAGR